MPRFETSRDCLATLDAALAAAAEALSNLALLTMGQADGYASPEQVALIVADKRRVETMARTFYNRYAEPCRCPRSCA